MSIFLPISNTVLTLVSSSIKQIFLFLRESGKCKSNNNIYRCSNIRCVILDIEVIANENTSSIFLIFYLYLNIIYKIKGVPLLILFHNISIFHRIDCLLTNNYIFSRGLLHVIISRNNITIKGIDFSRDKRVYTLVTGPTSSSINFHQYL